MSGEIATVCCCDTGRTWYAVQCPDLLGNYCCPAVCTNSPARIEFCESYLLARGIPIPPDPAFCYIFGYDCCAYVLDGFIATPCPNPNSQYPQNVGNLIGVYPNGGLPCCRVAPATQLYIGTMADITVPNCGPVLVQDDDPCIETLGDCYTYCDQYGTVKGKEPEVSATLSMCAILLGVPWDIRCDHGPPDSVVKVEKKIRQKIGPCIACDTRNGVPEPMPCTFIAECPSETRTEWRYEDQCPDCRDLIFSDCCGGLNPCDFDPNACAGTIDTRRSYRTRTCYSVQNCENNFDDRGVVQIDIPFCVPISYGVDPYNQTAVNNFIRDFFISIGNNTKQVGSCWGIYNATVLRICNLYIDIVSGNSDGIVRKINGRLGALMKATSLNPYFWFGVRQACEKCPWQGPQERPPYIDGDELYISSVNSIALTQTVRVILSGRAQRKFVCAAISMNTLEGDQNCRQDASANGEWVTAAQISGYGLYPYQLDCLSVPEVSGGSRYRMMEVEQQPNVTDICVAPNVYQTVPSCDARAGWPLDDLIIYGPNGEIVDFQFGWTTLCPAMPEPKFGCRCYPYVYTPAPCCPVGYPDCDQWFAQFPVPEPCVNANFQTPQNFCYTDAKLFKINWCGD